MENNIHSPIIFNPDLAEHEAELIINIEPIGKARPRVTARGPFAHAYTPKKTKDYEHTIKNEYLKKYGYNNILQGPIEAETKAYFSIPKSSSKKEKKDMLKNKIKHTHKPDCDNFAKAVLDALNGVAFNDDSQIIRLKAEKFYSENPRVEITLKEIKYENYGDDILESISKKEKVHGVNKNV